MKKYFDYSVVPHSFVHCTNAECLRIDKCLRYLLVSGVPSDKTILRIVNPAAIPANGTDCKYFFLDQKVRFACGITRLLDNLPHSKAVSIKRSLTRSFSNGTYYRIRRKERLISPDEQDTIRDIFRANGIKEEPLYDEYIDHYEWPD